MNKLTLRIGAINFGVGFWQHPLDFYKRMGECELLKLGSFREAKTSVYLVLSNDPIICISINDILIANHL